MIASRLLSVLRCLLVLVAVSSLAGAQDRPNDEPSSFDTLMERTDLGNVRQAARMSYHGAMRDLERARNLASKAGESEGKERDKLEKRSAAAYERAIGGLTEALRTDPKLLEAYTALGRAYLETGKHQESLQVHAAALKQHPDDAENQEGMAEALLELNRLRDAAAAYNILAENDKEMAARLLAKMKLWVEERRADPAGVAPEAVEALATLIQQWEQASG